MSKIKIILEKISKIEELIEELEFTPSRLQTFYETTEIKEILDEIKELIDEK